MSKFREMTPPVAPERVSEKISNFLNMNILYIILKHLIWNSVNINFFSEIFKFRENTSKTNFDKFLKVFRKSPNLNISQK